MRTRPAGFTLVEVLVISPIIILFVGTFIAMLVNLTGESLVIRERNIAIHDSQAALDDIQTNLTQATGFLTTTGTLQSPQGSNNSTAPFTNTPGSEDALILKIAATTSGPNDAGRSLVYTGAGACDSKNPVYNYYMVYFVELDTDTADPADKALFRRTILPAAATCADTWQRGSCAASVKASNPTLCERSDEKLVSGVSTFNIEYFSNTAPVSDSAAATATEAKANLGIGKQVAGSSVDYSASVQTTSLNVQSADAGSPAPPPTNPAITVFRNTSNPYPYRTTISWSRIGNATGYRARYTLGGGAVQTVNLGQTSGSTSPTFDIDASHRKQAIVLTEVKILTSSGEVDYGTLPPISSIPSWNECTFQNGWTNYGGPYTTGGYTKTSSKLVGLKGLVRSGGYNQTVCTLPVGFRPKFADEKLIFQVATGNGANWGRVDIYPSGDIHVVQGSNEWVSLDGIIFAADDSTYNWTSRVWEYGWSNYGAGHSTLRSTTDSEGRIHIQGLGSYPGTSPNGNVMTNVGTGPSNTLHIPAMAGGPGIVQVNTNGWVLVRSSPNSYQQIQLMYRPGSATGWQNLSFSGGWQNYGSGWPDMRCHRGTDDVVVMQGLVNRPAGDGNGIYIGNTLPCGRFSSGEGAGVKDRLLLSVWTSNEAPGRIDMQDGNALLPQSSMSAWTPLDGIHFIAD